MIKPEMIFFPSYMIFSVSTCEGFSTEIGCSFLLPFHHQCISNEFMNTCHLNSRHPVFQEGWKGCTINRTDTGQQVHPVLLLHILNGICSRESPSQTHLHILIRTQSGPASTAKGPFFNRVLRHFVKLRAHLKKDIPGLLNQSH